MCVCVCVNEASAGTGNGGFGVWCDVSWRGQLLWAARSVSRLEMRVSGWLCVCVECVCMHVCVRMYACVCVTYECVYVCACVHDCMCVCVCVPVSVCAGACMCALCATLHSFTPSCTATPTSSAAGPSRSVSPGPGRSVLRNSNSGVEAAAGDRRALEEQIRHLNAMLQRALALYPSLGGALRSSQDALAGADPIPPWMSGSSVASPLLVAYEGCVHSLQEQVDQAEVDVTRMARQMKDLTEENQELRQRLIRYRGLVCGWGGGGGTCGWWCRYVTMTDGDCDCVQNCEFWARRVYFDMSLYSCACIVHPSFVFCILYFASILCHVSFCVFSCLVTLCLVSLPALSLAYCACSLDFVVSTYVFRILECL